MKWMLGVGALFACAICGLLGLIAGINLNPTATVKFVPDMGSLADWVSGFGSVSAAIVALYLADQQRKSNTAKIEISQYYNEDNFTVDLVSTGEKSAIVKGVFLRSPRYKKQILLNRSPLKGFAEIVGRYEYGETRRLTIDKYYYFGIGRELLEEIGSFKFDDLQLVVAAGIGEFKVELHPSFKQSLLSEANPPKATWV